MPKYKEMPAVSKSEINRCGAYLVDLHRADDFTQYAELFDALRVAHATQVVDDFRAAHQKPLSIVSTGLRQFVHTALKEPPVVSQRLKRLPRIIRKLANMHDSNLARLEDIGGTRAIVATLEEQSRLCAHIERVWGHMIKRRRDYVQDPKNTGYRARHFVIVKDGRNIEIQVRTVTQQNWANAIEQTDSRLNSTLKDGTGDARLLDYFTAAGDMLSQQETGEPLTPDMLARYAAAVDDVVAAGYFVRRGN